MCCSVLKCVAVYCSVLQSVTVCCRVLRCVAACRSVCCGALQCVAVVSFAGDMYDCAVVGGIGLVCMRYIYITYT